MSPFVQPRARAIGNTFIIEEERDSDSSRRPTMSGPCKRRHSYNHRAYCHSSLQVDRSSLLEFARTLPPKAKMLPLAAEKEQEARNDEEAKMLLLAAEKEQEARHNAKAKMLWLTAEEEQEACNDVEEPEVRVVQLSLAVPEVAELPQRSFCQASAPLELPAAAVFQVGGHVGSILSTPGPMCSPTAQAFFLSSPVHGGTAFSPVGAGNYCCGTAPTAHSPMMWEPRSPACKVDNSGVPCLPLQSLIPPPSPAVTAETSVPWSPAGSSDMLHYTSEGSLSVDSTPSVHSVAASEASSRRRGRRTKGSAGAPAASTPVGAAPAKAATPTVSTPATSPTSSGLAKPTSGPIGAPVRPQPREELVRELLRTGASALERASALAKEINCNSCQPRRR